MCFALGFYEALLGLLNPVDNLQFYLEAFEFMFFVNNILLCFHTLQTMHLPLACLSSHLLFLKNKNKKEAGTSHRKGASGKR